MRFRCIETTFEQITYLLLLFSLYSEEYVAIVRHEQSTFPLSDTHLQVKRKSICMHCLATPIAALHSLVNERQMDSLSFPGLSMMTMISNRLGYSSLTLLRCSLPPLLIETFDTSHQMNHLRLSLHLA